MSSVSVTVVVVQILTRDHCRNYTSVCQKLNSWPWYLLIFLVVVLVRG